MSDYTIRQLAKLCGISVRTLHYYDQIGLLCPAYLQENGYRMYSQAELLRLQQILFFRELNFPLKEIKAILENPAFDYTETLCRQKELLLIKRNHLNNLIDSLSQLLKGETMNMNVFNDTAFQKAKKQYSAEAKERFGNTDAWAEYEEKSSQMDSMPNAEKANAIFTQLTGYFQEKISVHDSRVQACVADWQNYITENFYTCTKEILSQLSLMYIHDSRFTEFYDKNFAVGLAQYFHDAIQVYCA